MSISSATLMFDFTQSSCVFPQVGRVALSLGLFSGKSRCSFDREGSLYLGTSYMSRLDLEAEVSRDGGYEEVGSPRLR